MSLVEKAAERVLLGRHVEVISAMQRSARGGRKALHLVMRPALAEYYAGYFDLLNRMLEARMLARLVIRLEDDLREVIGVQDRWVQDVVWISRGRGDHLVCGYLKME